MKTIFQNTLVNACGKSCKSGCVCKPVDYSHVLLARLDRCQQPRWKGSSQRGQVQSQMCKVMQIPWRWWGRRGGSTRELGSFESLLSRGVSQSIRVVMQRLAVVSRIAMMMVVLSSNEFFRGERLLFLLIPFGPDSAAFSWIRQLDFSESCRFLGELLSAKPRSAWILVE